MTNSLSHSLCKKSLTKKRKEASALICLEMNERPGLDQHVYCRLRFDEASEEAITQLARVLQWHRNSMFENMFVAQMDQRAGKL